MHAGGHDFPSTPRQYQEGEVVKFTYYVALNFYPVFIPLNQLSWAILDFGLRICCIALLCHFLLN